MKSLPVLVLLCSSALAEPLSPKLLEQHGSPSQPSTLSLLAELPAVLNTLDLYPTLRPHVARVRAELPALVTRTQQISSCSGCSIDFVLMVHGTDPKQVPSVEVQQSQQLVYDLLLDNTYDVLGTEGDEIDRWTIDALTRLVLAKAGRSSDVDFARLRDYIAQAEYFNGVHRYAMNFPDAVVIGPEDEALHDLQWETLQVMDSTVPMALSPELEHANEVVGAARSEVCVMAMLTRLNAMGRTKGLLSMGALHEPSLINAARVLGVSFRLFDTRNLQPTNHPVR